MIAIQSITLNSNGTWTFSWADIGAAFYRVVLWGKQLATIIPLAGMGSYTWTGLEYRTFPPPLEVMPGSQLANSEIYSPVLIVQWYGERAAARYLIQTSADNGVTWTPVAQDIQETGLWIYTWITAILTDETTYLYRAIAVDSVGNQSPPRQFKIYVVTNPIPPDPHIQISYNKPNAVISAI